MHAKVRQGENEMWKNLQMYIIETVSPSPPPLLLWLVLGLLNIEIQHNKKCNNFTCRIQMLHYIHCIHLTIRLCVVFKY